MELIAASLGVGSMVCIAVVAKVARNVLDGPSQMVFLRSMNRRYSVVGATPLLVFIASALALLASVERLVDNPYVFPSPITGRPSASIFFPWNRIRKRAGLADVRLHDLRHSFASCLVNAGKDLYVVQKLLGHSHARSTQRYAHLAPNTLADAAEVVARAVDAATRPVE